MSWWARACVGGTGLLHLCGRTAAHKAVALARMTSTDEADKNTLTDTMVTDAKAGGFDAAMMAHVRGCIAAVARSLDVVAGSSANANIPPPLVLSDVDQAHAKTRLARLLGCSADGTGPELLLPPGATGGAATSAATGAAGASAMDVDSSGTTSVATFLAEKMPQVVGLLVRAACLA